MVSTNTLGQRLKAFGPTNDPKSETMTGYHGVPPRLRRYRGQRRERSRLARIKKRRLRPSALPRRRLPTFELLARILGTLLEVVLPLLLLLLEHFGIGRWPVIGFVKTGERQWKVDGLVRTVDGLHDQDLALLQLADQLVAGFIVRRAAVDDAVDVRRIHRL